MKEYWILAGVFITQILFSLGVLQMVKWLERRDRKRARKEWEEWKDKRR